MLGAFQGNCFFQHVAFIPPRMQVALTVLHVRHLVCINIM